MATIQISVIDPAQAEKTNMEVPDDVPVEELTEAIVSAMQLPSSGVDGRPTRYQLNQRRDDGRLTRLDPGQTLAQNSVRSGEALQLTAEMTAGK